MIKKTFLTCLFLSCLNFAFAGDVVKKEYYPNGKIKSEAHYNQNYVLDGLYTEYYSSGTEYRVESYVNGKLTGTANEYYPRNILRSKENWVNGKKNGEQLLYYKNHQGKIYKKLQYIDGKLQSELSFDKSGNKVYERIWSQSETIVKKYDNNVVDMEFTFDLNNKLILRKDLHVSENSFPLLDYTTLMSYLKVTVNDGIDRLSNLADEAFGQILMKEPKYWTGQDIDILYANGLFYYLFVRTKLLSEDDPHKKTDLAKLVMLSEGLLEDGYKDITIEGLLLPQVNLMLKYELNELQTGIKSSYEKNFILSYLGAEKSSKLWSYDMPKLISMFAEKVKSNNAVLVPGVVKFVFGDDETLYDGLANKLIDESLKETTHPLERSLMQESLRELLGYIQIAESANPSAFSFDLQKMDDVVNRLDYVRFLPQTILADMELGKLDYMFKYLGKEELKYGDKIELDMETLVKKTIEDCYNQVVSSYKNIESVVTKADFLLSRYEDVSFAMKYYSFNFLNDVLFPEIYKIEKSDPVKARLMSSTLNDVLEVVRNEVLLSFSKEEIDPYFKEGTFSEWTTEYNTAHENKRKMDMLLGTLPNKLNTKVPVDTKWSDEKVNLLYGRVTNGVLASSDIIDVVDYVEYLLDLKMTAKESIINKCIVLMDAAKNSLNGTSLSAAAQQKLWSVDARLFKAQNFDPAYVAKSNVVLERSKVVDNLKEYSGVDKDKTLSLEELETQTIKKLSDAINNETAGVNEVKMLIGESGFLYYFVNTITTPAEAGAFFIMSELVKAKGGNLQEYNSVAWNECLIKYDDRIKELKAKSKDFDVDFNTWIEKYKQKDIDIKIENIRSK